MKKSILNLGKALSKADQKNIKGGITFITYPFPPDGTNVGLPSGGGNSGETCSSLVNQSTCISKSGCVWYGCYCETPAPHIAPCS